MRQDQYTFQTRQHKIGREESASQYHELSKVSSYTSGHWKSYIPHEVSLSSEKRSQRGPSYHNNNHNYTSYRNTTQANYDTRGENDSRAHSIISVRKEEERQRQQSAIRKVRELQDKVLPLVKGNRDDDNEKWLGWQSKIQQKLVRLQGHVQNMKQQMQLQLERRMVEVENKWSSKLESLEKAVQERS